MKGNTQIEHSGVHIPGGADLETWSTTEWRDGIEVDRLGDLDTLIVETQNHEYVITVIDGREGEIVLRGGQFFPEMTRACLAGATLGGSFIKVRGIYLGFSMEFLYEGRRIITSSVRTIAVTRHGTAEDSL